MATVVAGGMVSPSAKRLPSKHLFEYRIRKMFDRWYILTTGEDYEFERYFDARDYAKILELQGYVDGDK